MTDHHVGCGAEKIHASSRARIHSAQFHLVLVVSQQSQVDVAAALDTQFTAFPFLSSVPDIPDIPENIKGCQALQIVDFSSNPIPR